MDIRAVRDKIFSFLFPVLLVAVILGTTVWILGKTYFWDTSRVSLQILTEKPAMVSLSVDARLIYMDTTFLSFPYSIHLTLPWSREVSCMSPCILDRIPAGDAVLTVQIPGEGIIRETLFIAPDTSGEIDLRPKIIATPVIDPTQTQKLQAPEISATDRGALPRDPFFSNTIQGLFLIKTDTTSVYDASSKQLLALPAHLSPERVGRGEKEGTYMLFAAGAVQLYDRYGRTPTQILPSITKEKYTFTWKTRATQITTSEGSLTLEGIWWPFLVEKNLYVTDGERINIIK